ncbi:GAP1-N1 domain-containing protein [Salipiger marinus]|uniref:GAP1-N1 domain-containing protein n=1 Tax=Salipiger marinus TaxID=555512 RepID=UPI004059435D
MSPPDKLEVDQALFGYSEGHRQLASSVSLPSKDVYELSMRSDLTPGASLSRTKSYISGFQLPETRLYALIKTWPAPEMPRPGCVWSHVLLLSRSFLTKQVNLGVLVDLFRRPEGRADAASYNLTLKVRRMAKSPTSSREDVAGIISSYYCNEPVLLNNTPDEAFERAIFDVWSQQWPRLRSEFSFRTVQSSDAVRDKGLTIKVSSNAREGARADRPKQAWVEAAVDDATSQTITSLRRFLWRYGKDVAAPRRSFPHLVEIHDATSQARSGVALAVAEQILARFPKASDAITLKRDLLGASPPALAIIPRARGSDILRLLAKWHAVEDGLVEADELRRVIASFDKDDLIAMAEGFSEVEQPVSREVEIAADALVATLNVDVVEIANLCKPIMLKVLKHRPDLLETFDVERLAQREAIDLISVATSPEAISNLLRRILSSPPSEEASAAASKYAELAFCEAVELSITGDLGEEWEEVFIQLVDDILPHGIAMLVGGSDRAAHGLSLLGFPIQGSPSAAAWNESLGDASNDDRSPDRSTVDAFLLGLCLRDGVAQTIPILAQTLPRLRYMALLDMLSTDARALLHSRLPSISESWDLNKRMLKVLRKANRDAIDIGPVVSQLSLTKEELSYVFGEDDEKSYPFPLTRLFWPW